ncbi:unnamed protein product [Diatraea saccharalis]|uniref:Chitin-binding type-2 domain-containing protein n=1 Tax=Diatraea saccharalis TaxID=40085 RepID=A0A9N9R1B1_9NEOP|nr:unnamed protein product [Diatraea saccharalis]
MARQRLLFMCITLTLFYVVAAVTQGLRGSPVRTRFTCQGRASGYYADVETGCQVYHMCDGLGRQFSYTCPNTTLFQQRMLICDHWYMVNCSKSESDYSANLLIGQRDKPFVSEEDMKRRTPRPDILSVPPNDNYYDGLREAESKYPIHPGNSIVGIADTISFSNNNGLDNAKQNYRPPSSWSTGTGNHKNTRDYDQDNLTGAASQEPIPTFQTTPDDSFNEKTRIPTPPPDLNKFSSPTKSRPSISLDLRPPLPDKITTTESPESEEYDIDVRKKTTPDPVYTFIRRFDPNSPDSHKTAMSKSEIINLNKHLPEGQISAEDTSTDKSKEREQAVTNDLNKLNNVNVKSSTEGSRFDTSNLKPTVTESGNAIDSDVSSNIIPKPDRNLLPPKTDFSDLPSTTMGPPVYYEWKWAVPAFDLEPPKSSNNTNNETSEHQAKSIKGRSPFSTVTRPTPVTVDPTPSNTEYNISSYFVPDYIFPLDKPHPGYEDEDAHTSFQVKIGRTGRASFGENPACPQCHPAYLKPGTCEPCIVNR